MKKILLTILCAGSLLQGCDYLDIIPDNVATLEHSFANEATTRNYLFTCYAGLPSETNIYTNPGFLSGDEYWSWENLIKYSEEMDIYKAWMIARGDQNSNTPYLDVYGDGGMWKTIRKCNTFIERVDGVKGLDRRYAIQWKAEAKVIKAYCHFYLMRMYGPIPLIKESLPVDAEPEEIRFKRDTWDDCVDYVVQLLDEATPDLPEVITNRTEELGRMTQAIALALKAKVLLTSASPQFNGNTYYTNFKNKDGQALFGDKDEKKWQAAADACKKAIDFCVNTANMDLYTYTIKKDIPAQIKNEYTLRECVTNKDWNDELIWGSVINPGGIQKYAAAYMKNTGKMGGHLHLVLNVNMKIAKQYYTSHGIPITEDKAWQGKNLEALRTAETDDEKLLIDGTTAELNFDREPRFYASLGFNCGKWYGAGTLDNAPNVVKGLLGEVSNQSQGERCNVTGYWAKKLIQMESVQSGELSYTSIAYPWPIIRLADLYLMYAEALNEAGGDQPAPEVYIYIDKVRERAGLKGVKDSWSIHSTSPNKPNSKDGMREIIQRERLIELSLEGHRFWDLRRWLLTTQYMEEPVIGWNCGKKTTEDYYKTRVLAFQMFTARDYLWPLSISLLNKNPNLVQTIGW